jgi:hypothetical protein
MKTFFLGTHMPNWLHVPGEGEYFVSVNTLRRQKKYRPSWRKWAVDSGAFSELSMKHKWTITASQYTSEVIRFRDEIGKLEWVAPQDWMCEPFIIAKTGLDVRTHQIFTVQNFLELRSLLGGLVIPVLQGWSPWDYLKHVEMYDKAGIDLRKERTVGVGSICRRQHTAQACTILTLLHSEGLRLHAFGLKLGGLKLSHHLIQSADSMAWSFDARRTPHRLPGHTHKNCANCYEFAELWREKIKPFVTV